MQHVLRLPCEDTAATLCRNHGLPVEGDSVGMKTAVFREKEGTDTLWRDDSWVGGWSHPRQLMINYLLYGKWGISTG